MISEQIIVENATNEKLQQHLLGNLQPQYNIDLNSSTVDSIEMTTKKGRKKTSVQILRSAHRPFLLTLRVDNKKGRSVGNYYSYTKGQEKSRRNNQDRSFYRYYFYYIIIGAVSTAVYFILDAMFPTNSAKLVFLGSLVLLVILYFILKSPMRKQMEKRMDAFDTSVFNDIKECLSRLQVEGVVVESKKCWNCFKEVDHKGGICPHCDVKLT